MLSLQTQYLNTTLKNNRVEFYTDTFDEFSFEQLKDELEEILNILDITPYHLQHEIIGPRIIQAYKKLRSEKSITDGYIILLRSYARSIFRGFENCFRILVALNEVDIQMILNNTIQILSLMKYHLEFIELKMFLKLFILLVIMKILGEPHILIIP